MNRKQSNPGVTRDDRIADEGLQRLDKQLGSGVRVSQQVLSQWIKRYGKPAVEIIKRHGCYSAALDVEESGEAE